MNEFQRKFQQIKRNVFETLRIKTRAQREQIERQQVNSCNNGDGGNVDGGNGDGGNVDGGNGDVGGKYVNEEVINEISRHHYKLTDGVVGRDNDVEERVVESTTWPQVNQSAANKENRLSWWKQRRVKSGKDKRYENEDAIEEIRHNKFRENSGGNKLGSRKLKKLIHLFDKKDQNPVVPAVNTTVANSNEKLSPPVHSPGRAPYLEII